MYKDNGEYIKRKAKSFDIKNYKEIVNQIISLLDDNSWYPLCTLMTGWTRGTEEDTIDTLIVQDELMNKKLFYVPLPLVHLKDYSPGKVQNLNFKDIIPTQWDLIPTCWRNNINLWRTKYKPEIIIGSLFANLLYFRWNNSKKAFYRTMKYASFPDSFLRKWVYNGCEKIHCINEEN